MMLFLICIGNIFLTTPSSSFIWNTGLLNFNLVSRPLFIRYNVEWNTPLRLALSGIYGTFWIAMLLCIIAFALARPYIITRQSIMLISAIGTSKPLRSFCDTAYARI